MKECVTIQTKEEKKLLVYHGIHMKSISQMAIRGFSMTCSYLDGSGSRYGLGGVTPARKALPNNGFTMCRSSLTNWRTNVEMLMEGYHFTFKT